jgi:hypothetical protein
MANLPILEKTGGMIVMVSYSIASFQNSIGCSPAWLILELIGSIALIYFSDWYCRGYQRRLDSSVAELEALFALEDCRVDRSYRSRYQS